MLSEYDKSRRDGFIALSLRDNDELVRVIMAPKTVDLLMFSKFGSAIRFSLEEVRAVGRDASGVRGMKLRYMDEVVDCIVVQDDLQVLLVTESGYGKRTKVNLFSRQARGGQGVRAIRLTQAKGQLISAFTVSEDDEVLLVSSSGVTIRTSVREIAVQGRDATGVHIINLAQGETVASVAPVMAGLDAD